MIRADRENAKSEPIRRVCPTCHGDGTVPNPDARCSRCGHRQRDHHYSPGGGCCVEVDRYERCQCPTFLLTAKLADAFAEEDDE